MPAMKIEQDRPETSKLNPNSIILMTKPAAFVVTETLDSLRAAADVATTDRRPCPTLRRRRPSRRTSEESECRRKHRTSIR